MATTELSDALSRAIATGDVPTGSLRVFGDWFGRPHDNRHRPVAVESMDSLLTVRFDRGENLHVWEPAGITITRYGLSIRTAARVRWEWFAYGRRPTPENFFVEEHWIEGGHIRATSTADWYHPTFAPSLAYPAVELQ